MVLKEYTRYLRKKSNIFIMLLAYIPAVFSYYFTYMDKQYWYKEIQRKPADMNIEAAIQDYEGINGFTYLFDFIFSGDYFIIFMILLTIVFSAILGGVEHRNRTEGFGNMILARGSAKKITMQIVMAQALYVITFIAAYFLFLVGITLIVFPVNENIEFSLGMNISTSSVWTCLGLIVAQMVMLMVYETLLMVITYMCSIMCRNKYIVMAIPSLFYIVTFFGCSLLAYVGKRIGVAASYLVVDKYLGAIYSWYSASSMDILDVVVLPLFLGVIAVAGWKYYIQTIEGNYL